MFKRFRIFFIVSTVILGHIAINMVNIVSNAGVYVGVGCCEIVIKLKKIKIKTKQNVGPYLE